MMKPVFLVCLFGILGINADPVGICPSQNGEFVDFLTDDSDCNKFYKCDWGSPVLYTCPSDLHFNPTLNVCDWPGDAGCTSGGLPPVSPTTTTTSTPVAGKCSTVSCPVQNGDFPVFHPHPEDCGKYCVCDWGVGIEMDCPAGLHFNPTLNVCDWPADAGCGDSPPGEPTTSSTSAPEGTTPTPEGTTSIPGKCSTVSCPAQNGDFPVFHPHPEDCGKYCVCDWGVGIEMDCPAGLHFNPTLNVCDWPADAGCGDSPPGEPTTSSTSAPEGTTPTPEGTTSIPGKCSTVSCPAQNGDFPVFHPHPEDCGKYCVCDWGVGIEMDCPAGLHFNPTLNVCDWPADAGCGDSPPGEPTTSSTSAPEGTTPTPEGTTSAPEATTPTPEGTTSIPGKCSTVSCPAQNGDFPVFHPHPEDCGKYCVCDWGVGIEMDCPAGLHFNPTLNVCDWPADAGCGDSPPGEPTTSSTSAPEGTTPTPEGTTSIPGKCSTVSCPAQNGDFPVFHPHPEDCGKYCVCDWGVGIEMDCPAGLHFNPTLNVCDWPADAGCGDSPPGEPTTSSTSAPEGTTPTPEGTTSAPEATTPTPEGTTSIPGKCSTVSCPAQNGDFPVFHPHPEDCGKYCVCDWGVGIEMDCPAGLHFNPTLNVCDWPADAGCGDSPPGEPTTSSTSAPEGTTPTPEGTTSAPEGTTPTPEGTTSIPGKCSTVSCPAQNGDFPVFHPHPEDCGKYCVCDWGVGIEMDCPAGLHFNPTLNVCDWPADAGCGDSPPGEPTTSSTSAPEGTTPTPEGTTSAPEGTTPTPEGTTSIPGKCSTVSCPAQNGDFPVFHPHPEDCGKYCVCDWGVGIEMDCPAGLHFNPTLNVCDWPADAGCGDSPPGEPTTSSTSAPEGTTPTPEGTTSAPEGTTSIPGKCSTVSCPAQNGDFPVFHPHPEDCGKYCICDWGVGIEMDCPSGLHFNPTKNVCDWPADAGCGDSTPGEPTTSSTSAPEGTTPIPEGTTAAPEGTTSISGKCSTVSCPAQNGDFPVFHPHPDECGRYCICDWGVGFDMACPSGLHFNPTLNVCDWPADAGCDDTIPSTTTTQGTPSETTSTSTSAPGSCSNVSCPAKNGIYPVFHSHPNDCGRYCKCDWGVAYDMPCSEGLHFNPTLNVCDWPGNPGSVAAGC